MKFLYFLLFIFSAVTCSREVSPSVEKRESQYYDSIRGQEVYITEYLINNQSDNCYYTWLLPQPQFSGEKCITHYFFKPNGDFSLSQLINDNIIFNEGFVPVLGYSFIKLILPGQSFSYLVISEESLDEEKDIGGLIFMERKEIVESIAGPIPDRFLFSLNCVVLKM